MDWPQTAAITISWDALVQAGEHNEGHCLGRGEKTRDTYLRQELARLCRSAGRPFAALWARDVGTKLGLHTHISMFWPTHEFSRLVAYLERITGSPLGQPSSRGLLSSCHGWLLKPIGPVIDNSGALRWANYIASQRSKHPARSNIDGKLFGVTEAIGQKAQADAGFT